MNVQFSLVYWLVHGQCPAFHGPKRSQVLIILSPKSAEKWCIFQQSVQDCAGQKGPNFQPIPASEKPTGNITDEPQERANKFKNFQKRIPCLRNGKQ
jgi:hypothetical protein